MVGWKDETCAHDYKKYSGRARTVHVNLKSRLPLPLPLHPLPPVVFTRRDGQTLGKDEKVRSLCLNVTTRQHQQLSPGPWLLVDAP